MSPWDRTVVPMENTHVRLLICDDHELVRRGLRDLVEADLTMKVVAEAASADEAIRLAAETKPDVALVDVRMPGRSGIEACREIRAANEGVKVIILTSFADDEALFSAIMAGASGYLLKNVGGGDLLEGIHSVARGRSLLDPALTARVLARIRGEEGGSRGPADDLTPQERKILALIGEGLTNRQIGEKVNLAEKTVKNYVSNILMKLGLSRRAEVAAYVARRQGPTRSGDATSWS